MNLTLLTDLYQLTMAFGYWRHGLARREACFHLYFRTAPFGGTAAVAAGLAPAIELLEGFGFQDDDLAYLATLTGNDSRALFPAEFLTWLGEMRLDCDVAAVEEGEVVSANTPLLRLTGPLALLQLLETPLLNVVNFQTLIATKAARVCEATGGEPVLEFGLRRAQGVDGGLAAARASFLGGCAATSNVLAGKRFGIPVKGTHAHSWVMVFGDEVEAFEKYAEAMPNNAVLLVDTYDTLQGVRHAVEVGKQLAARGHALAGIRLDSGDMAALSIEARKILDGAGLTDVAIVASSDLDEDRIRELKANGARIGVWGVGTRLVTAWDQPALGGVYKLAAIQDEAGVWQPRIKRSENPIKTTTPGIHQVCRSAEGDILWSETLGPPAQTGRNLLVPIFSRGQRVYSPPSLVQSRERAMKQWAERAHLSEALTLEPRLAALKESLLAGESR
ncbi:MAG: nicotinate phosphoribosyltransferase [Myxococcota bacterium]|jgi:nicotinate phosphoribosyltransferase